MWCRKINANSMHFVSSNKDCEQMSSSLINKGLFCLLVSSIPFNDLYFLTQIPTNQLTSQLVGYAYILAKSWRLSTPSLVNPYIRVIFFFR